MHIAHEMYSNKLHQHFMRVHVCLHVGVLFAKTGALHVMYSVGLAKIGNS